MSANNNKGLSIRAAGDTNVGRQRDTNEDNVYLSPPAQDPGLIARHGRLYIVADGVGGNRGGAQASEIACRRIPQYYYAGTSSDPGINLRLAIEGASREIAALANRSADFKDMSCTVAIAIVGENNAVVAHIGDARVYLLNRDGRLQLLTEDHTWVQEQVRKGTISLEEARRHPNRNVITRSLGHQTPQPDVSPPFDLNDGDRLLICSDGLTGDVNDALITRILQQNPNPENAVKALIGQANQNGGSDNITAVVVNIGTPARAPAGAPLRQLMPIAAVGMLALFLVMLLFGRPPSGVTSADAPPEGTALAEGAVTAGGTSELDGTVAGDEGASPPGTDGTVTATLNPAGAGGEATATETPTPTNTVAPETTAPNAEATRTPTPTPTAIHKVTWTPLPPPAPVPQPELTIFQSCVNADSVPANKPITLTWVWMPSGGQLTLKIEVIGGPTWDVYVNTDLRPPDRWEHEGTTSFHTSPDEHDYDWRVVVFDSNGIKVTESNKGCFKVQGVRPDDDSTGPPPPGATPPTPSIFP